LVTDADERGLEEIRRLNDAQDTLSDSFPGHATLTPRERVVLAQIVRAFPTRRSRALGISPRTVEFHRANFLKKVSARNTVDLLRKILGE